MCWLGFEVWFSKIDRECPYKIKQRVEILRSSIFDMKINLSHKTVFLILRKPLFLLTYFFYKFSQSQYLLRKKIINLLVVPTVFITFAFICKNSFVNQQFTKILFDVFYL